MNIALVLSGGTGTRLGSGIPKQYIEVCGSPVISYSIRYLSEHNRIDAVQIAADPAWQVNRQRTPPWQLWQAAGSVFP